MPSGQLPEGLVTTNNETVREEIGNVDRVDLEDIARLWRDYSTSRALLHDNTGERLANFFWRIWSNPAISKSIPGSTVARLFMTMSEGGNRVRTTPIPSPRPTSPLSRDTTPTPSSPQALAEQFPTVGIADAQTATSSSTGTNSEPASGVADTHASSARSRPTLKKAGPISSSPSTSKKSPTSPSGTTSPISPTNAGDRSLSNGNRKRASYVTAGGARAKTRPSLARRKSNQGPSLAVVESKKSPRTASRKSPPPRTSPLQQAQARPTVSKVAAMAPPSGLPSLPSTTSPFALPSASWQDVSSPVSSQVGGPSTAATSQQPSSWLVDSNFRSKFVESQSRGASSTNLSGLGKSKSTVRFADQLPGRRATSGAVDRQTTAPASNTTPNAALVNAQARTRRGSGAIADDDDDEDDDDILPLSRTKSQLSLMIDQERRKSGTHELRPSPLQQEVHKEGGDETASKPKDNDDDDDDDDDDDADDDLLTMGRKDGVTRAGAIGGKARGKQKMSLKDSDKFLYQSPPTPPLY